MPRNKLEKSEPASLPGGMPAEKFLREYWQKQPLLMKNAFPGFTSPVDADTLAGLACEADVESRLVLEKHGPRPWHVEYGPFAETRFANLPETHWTLLVQSVDVHLPVVAELLNHFTFLPRWRLDDVMVSYAEQHGSVGPHIDQYDVFLLQGMGRRRWQISPPPADIQLLDDTDLRILKDFSASQEWVLEPGDMLYLPPGVPHFGVALDACITLSVGFRAPSLSEIFSGLSDDIPDEVRYADPDIEISDNRYRIENNDVERLKQLVLTNINNDSLARVLGQLVTEIRQSDEQEYKTSAVDTSQRKQFTTTVGTRLAYYLEAGNTGLLFANGETFEFSATMLPAIERLCRDGVLLRPADSSTESDSELDSLCDILVDMGAIEPLHED